MSSGWLRDFEDKWSTDLVPSQKLDLAKQLTMHVTKRLPQAEKLDIKTYYFKSNLLK